MRLFGKVVLGLIFVIMLTAVFALFHPRSTLPDAWKPFAPLAVTDQITPLTPFKLRRALQGDAQCRAALLTGATFEAMEDFERSPACHIRNRVQLTEVAGARLLPVETRCETALRLALWVEHGVKPAAQAHFNQGILRLRHASSYNCRAMRTSAGVSERMSTHATADSIDISGLDLSDGRRLMLIEGWPAIDARAPFFRAIHQSSCQWFNLSLGPDYNRLHADHFHLQNTGWGTCR
jgi:hypothetical protein